jgi:hypothetical protein
LQVTGQGVSAAVVLAISGGGALSSFETTVLMTVDETMDALGRPSKSRTELPARRGPPASVDVTRVCMSLAERATLFATGRIAGRALLHGGRHYQSSGQLALPLLRPASAMARRLSDMAASPRS